MQYTEKKDILNILFDKKIFPENDLLIDNDNIKNNTNYIYLLILREFIRTNENIYKIGRTSQNGMKRITQYPKGSQLIIFRKCIDCIKIESELIKEFKIKYIHKPEYGNEYFQGNELDMIKDINNIIDTEIKMNLSKDLLLDKKILSSENINNNKYNYNIIKFNEKENNGNKINLSLNKESFSEINNNENSMNSLELIIQNNLKKIKKIKKTIDLSNENIINNYNDLVNISDNNLLINIINIENKYGYYQFNNNNKSYFFGNDLDEKLIDVLYNNFSHISDIGYLNIIENKYISCNKFHSIINENKYNIYKLIFTKIDYEKIIENLCVSNTIL
jgi:hypothetical protein